MEPASAPATVPTIIRHAGDAYALGRAQFLLAELAESAERLGSRP
jgi:hypothetical protein